MDQDMEEQDMEDQAEKVVTASAIPGTGIEDYQIYQDYRNPLTNESHFGINEIEPDPYPSWCEANGASLTKEEIKQIFSDLTRTLGFQHDNLENMFDHLMVQLDSRSSRLPCPLALLSLHSDYIGGDRSNYKKWYFMAHYELDEDLKDPKIWYKFKKFKKSSNPIVKSADLNSNSLEALEFKWKQKMSQLTDNDYIVQLALYLLIWGEANNVRFLPECICFIFKCALDYYEYHGDKDLSFKTTPKFLDDVITPLYIFIRSQQYKLVNGKWIRNSKDHDSIIGYDDINQFFWFPENLTRIKLLDNSKLISDYQKHERFSKFKHINWNSFLYKTYREKRSWGHLFTNFSRVWIIHISIFWYYTSFNSPSLYTKSYSQLLDNPPASQVQWTIVSLAGTVATIIAIFATTLEFYYVPRKYPGSQNLTAKLMILILVAIVNVGPSVYILGFVPFDAHSIHGRYIGMGQFLVSAITVLYLAITPPSKYFRVFTAKNVNNIKQKLMVETFPRLDLSGQIFSIILWIMVFTFKFFESYFFLTLSLRDPIRVLSTMDLSRCRGDVIFQQWLCKYQAKALLGSLYVTDLVLFFLDTYLWYVIFNCIFSIGLSFSLGISVFTPWKNTFVRLPERIFSKVLYANKNSSNNGQISLVAQVWNNIIISMYRDHLLSLEQVNRLVYQFLEPDNEDHPRFNEQGYGKVFIKTPLFFVFQDDNSFSLSDYFKPGKEAERRISYFAQSLSSPIPEPIPTASMPAFTVLIPHYSEKILLTLKEIIKENKDSKVSVLDYLKQLNKADWESFVQDTKILSNLSPKPQLNSNTTANAMMGNTSEKSDPNILGTFEDQHEDLPYYSLGFKNSLPEYTLRTRIWASLRLQTLYRTVSGFMNYEKAIKILYHSENGRDISTSSLYPEETEYELDSFANRKFKLLLSLQRFQQFNTEEKNNIKVLFESFPSVNACYLEEELDEDTNQLVYYSTLLDLSSFNNSSTIEPTFDKKYRIRLSGNPILGDGKSDNQNHAIIYYRGEYIQVIDANQDNYLEECLKIKAVLAEFEEYNLDPIHEYVPGFISTNDRAPVAILGTREYIFSENIGVLGDIAAAKEQTFGTLFARTLAKIGGKLHYGHPDFLNAIFMTTRGGVSKAQKGLHLNEDIYAGMMATCRGGRIKHCDYYQCGKGRDLGFSTILNFTIKIGAGMGEQILSREHYYLGTSLPIDRFLSFYYAHAGFHLNNLFIYLSALLFMVVLIQLGSLKSETILCDYNPDHPITDLQHPLGCYNLQPVLNWVSRFVLSVVICFFISFLPLLFQELIEKGFIRAMLRLIYHFVSLLPFFEVFVCQIYAKSLQENISIGGAKYIATGRGFATSRESFPILYSRYSSLSLYKGFRFFITMVVATITMWQVSLLWFFISFISMCLAPLIFNPHQFSWRKFFLDYRELIRWFSRGNSRWHNNSWYGYQKLQRIKHIGFKKTELGQSSKLEDKFKESMKNNRNISLFHKLVEHIFIPIIPLGLIFMSYMFVNSQTGVSPKEFKSVNPLFRILILTFVPVVANGVVLLIGFGVSAICGPIFYFRKFSSVVSGIVRGMGVIIVILNFEILLYCESFNAARTLIGIILIISIQRLARNIVYNFFLTKEVKPDLVNSLWWSGKWLHNIKSLRHLVLTQPIREYVIKIIEQISFGYDFILCHFLLFSVTPILFIPFIDKWHTMMLFWSKPSKEFRNPIISKRLRTKQNLRLFKYLILYFVLLIILLGVIVAPIVVNKYYPIPDITKGLNIDMVSQLIQPNNQYNNDTGPNAPGVNQIEPPVMTTVF